MSETALVLPFKLRRSSGELVDGDQVRYSAGPLDAYLDNVAPLLNASVEGLESPSRPLAEAPMVTRVLALITAALGDVATDQELAAAVAGLASTAYVDTSVSGLVTTDALNTAINSRVTPAQLTAATEPLATRTELNDGLATRVTPAQQTTALQPYVLTSTLDGRLQGFVSQSNLTATLTGYVTAQSLGQQLLGFVTTQALDSRLLAYETTSTLLARGYITSEQAEDLLVNGALYRAAVKSVTTTAQPVSPSEGDRYILPAGRTGAAWSTFAVRSIAEYQSSAWVEITPSNGWTVVVEDDEKLARFTEGGWDLLPAVDVAAIKAELARTDAEAGALTIGIRDSGGHYAGSTVEAALSEVPGKITAAVTNLIGGATGSFNTLGKIETAIGLRVLTSDLSATGAGKGASLVGIQTITGRSWANVQEALVGLENLIDSLDVDGTAGAVRDELRDGVVAAGDTLKKLYDLILQRVTSTALGSTSAGQGASLVGIEAIVGLTATDLQTGLEQLVALINAKPSTSDVTTAASDARTGAVADIRNGVEARGNTLIKLLALIDGKEAAGAAAAVIGGASEGFNTLAKAETAIGTLAPKASPTFTGTPTAPTASPGTNTTQLATTAFVAAGLTDLDARKPGPDVLAGLPLPTLDVIANTAGYLPPEASLGRTASATYVDALGVTQTVAGGEPRLSFDPVSGEFLGYYLDGAEGFEAPVGDWYNPLEGTVWIEGYLTNVRPNPPGGTDAIVSLQGNGQMTLRQGEIITNTDFFVLDGSSGTAQVDSGSFLVSTSQLTRQAFAYTAGSFGYATDGQASAADVRPGQPGSLPPNITQMVVAFGPYIQFTLRRLVYIPHRISNDALVEMTRADRTYDADSWVSDANASKFLIGEATTTAAGLMPASDKAKLDATPTSFFDGSFNSLTDVPDTATDFTAARRAKLDSSTFRPPNGAYTVPAWQNLTIMLHPGITGVTLPTNPDAAQRALIFTVEADLSAAPITINPGSGNTIEGNASWDVDLASGTFALIYSGTNWKAELRSIP